MENKESKYAKTLEDLKEYINLRYDLLRLSLLEKLSKVISMLLIIIVSIMLAMMILIHFSFALVYKLSEIWDSKIYAFLCVGGIYLLIGIILYIFRKNIFVNPLVKQLSGILFDESDENIEANDTEIKQ